MRWRAVSGCWCSTTASTSLTRRPSLIEAILDASATVKILATSREGLRLADEQLWPVPSLDVGAGIDSAAVSLFIERAQAVSPGFSVANADEAAAVVEICGRLDGIPLAIELAASRTASMTVTEVRDRLDQRLRLLVGSRRGLERHQTLRHAVAWSYDHLDDAEKALLERCSVFAGGFDLQSACAVMGSDDDFATLDLLDALVRKSLLVADRSAGRTRFSMLETIRQFAEEQLVARGEASEIRAAHSRYFAGRETDILALWDSPRQREAYDWFTLELANLRTAFRWAADHGDLDAAAAIATYAGLLGAVVQTYEPVTWAEELIEPARAVDHPRLASLYVMASHVLQRPDGSTTLSGIATPARSFSAEAARRSRTASKSTLGAVYQAIGQPERWAELCRAQLARRRDTHVQVRTWMVYALALAGSGGEAMHSADSLIEDAEATGNPSMLAWALGPTVSRSVTQIPRGAERPQPGSGDRSRQRQPRPASALGIGSGTTQGRTRRHRWPHSIISLWQCTATWITATPRRSASRWPSSPFFSTGSDATKPRPPSPGSHSVPSPRRGSPEITTAIAHLRDVLGEATYESLAHKGETMTTAAMATYAHDQIDQARTELERPT